MAIIFLILSIFIAPTARMLPMRVLKKFNVTGWDSSPNNETLRAWFLSQKEAEAFEADPTHPNYHGDVAHLCQHCGYWHLSRPQWLEAERWTN